MALSPAKRKRHSIGDKMDKDEKPLKWRNNTMSHAMALPTAKRKRPSMGDVWDKVEKTSLALKRRKHTMTLRSHECVWTEDISMSRTSTVDSPPRTLPIIQMEAHHLLPPGYKMSDIVTRGIETRKCQLKRSSPEERIQVKRLKIKHKGSIPDDMNSLKGSETFTFVNTAAKNFKVYSYDRKRANDLIVRCQEEINASNDITPCTDSILLAAAEAPNEAINSFFQKFGNMQKGQIINMNAQVAVFIGEKESFDAFRQDLSQETFICKINTQSQSTSQTLGICREDWGFECHVNDLTKENISTYIDDVLEQFAMEKLANAANSLLKQGENAEEILAEVKELFKDTKVRMPDWLEKWEPNSKSQELKKKLEMISQQILDLPAVFACEISHESLKIMILKENESKLKDVIEYLGKLKLSNKEFEIRLGEIEPLAGDKFRSGDPVRVIGSGAGTLGGFAKFQKNGAEHPKIVAISAGHVLYDLVTYKTKIKVKKGTLGKRMECGLDIAIGEVTAPRSKCDTSFRTEDGKEGFAEIYQSNVSDLAKKRVHKWGAITSLRTAKISNIKISPTEAGKCMIIEKSNEKNEFARKGDSGSMVLMDRNPRDSPNMYAIGTLVGQLKHKKPQQEDTKRSMTTRLQTKQNKQQFVVVPLKEGFDYLSNKHDGTLSLYGQLDNE